MLKKSGVEKGTVVVKKLEEILEYRNPENPLITLYFDKVRFPDGKIGRYNRIAEGANGKGVIILPIHDVDEYFKKAWKNRWGGTFKSDVQFFKHYRIDLEDYAQRFGFDIF